MPLTKLEMEFQTFSSQTTACMTSFISDLHCFADERLMEKRIQMKKKKVGVTEEGSFQKDNAHKGDILEEKENEGTMIQLNAPNYAAQNIYRTCKFWKQILAQL